MFMNTNYINIFTPQSIQSTLANVAKADHAIFLDAVTMLVTLMLSSQNELCHFQALSNTFKGKLSTQCIQSCEEKF